jgi:hypothetical protein
MPPPFTLGRHLVASGCWSAKDQSAVVMPLEAVIPDTAEWCCPAQALKWRPGCPDEACMSLALPATGRHDWRDTPLDDLLGAARLRPTEVTWALQRRDRRRGRRGRPSAWWGRRWCLRESGSGEQRNRLRRRALAGGSRRFGVTLQWSSSSQGRASKTRLKGVWAARRKPPNPAAVTTLRRRCSPACAPRARPTSSESEWGTHNSVEAA